MRVDHPGISIGWSPLGLDTAGNEVRVAARSIPGYPPDKFVGHPIGVDPIVAVLWFPLSFRIRSDDVRVLPRHHGRGPPDRIPTCIGPVVPILWLAHALG